MAEAEIWKVYPDYPFVEVSNLGNVRTKNHWVTCKNGRKRLYKGHVLKQHLNRGGYLYVSFGMNGKQVTLYVHRMVATCFISNPNNCPEANHKDNDRANNVVSNLEWCTHEYNVYHKERFGTSAAEAVGRPVFAFNLETGKILRFETQTEALRQLGVDISHISAVAKGKRNKAGGYWFCNADSTAVEKTRSKFGDKIAEKVEELISKH